VSTSLSIPIKDVDLLAVEVKSRLAAATELDGYRVRVDRVPMLQEAVALVPGNILVAPTRLSSAPQVGCFEHEAAIGMLFPFTESPVPLKDDEVGPATLVDTVLGMVESWNKTIATPSTKWSFRDADATFFDSPDVEGRHRPTGTTLIGFLVNLTYTGKRFFAQP